MDINLTIKISADERLMGALAWIASIADETQAQPVETKRVEPAPEVSEEQEQPEPAEEQETSEPSVTLDEIRSYCTEIVRKDKSQRAGIKGLLDKYDAQKIPDLPQEHWREFWEAVQAL